MEKRMRVFLFPIKYKGNAALLLVNALTVTNVYKNNNTTHCVQG